ncbi:MAG: hypothetical protein DRO15_05990, partial [Thermoprotei archaeon]
MTVTIGGSMLRSEMLRTLLKCKTFIIGLSLITIIGIIAVLADSIALYPPLEFVGNPLESPSAKHPFGTDDMGRDIYSMTIHGARISLFIGIIAALLSTSIGTGIGVVCGVFRGIVDAVIMRIIDFMLSLPYLAIALVIIAFLKPSMMIIILVIVILSWITTAKVVRAHTLSVMESLFVEAARAIGA